MGYLRALVLPFVFVSPLFLASPALADQSWGGIAYTPEGQTFKLYDYSSREEVIADAKEKLDKKASVLLVQSGECAAVAAYHDAMGGMVIAAEKGHSLTEVAHKVLGRGDSPDQDSEHASLLNSFCQG